MAYSDEALAFRTIKASEQVRLEDRVSFLYLEYVQIRQSRTGVVAYDAGREGKNGSLEGTRARAIQLPVAGLAVLTLGPGTSISSAALTSCARAGTTVLITGGGGVPLYTHATPLTSSARWAIAQARLVSNEARQREAALVLYKKQLGVENAPGSSIATMRGLEGQLMRNTYRTMAAKYGTGSFARDTSSDDPVNAGLNLANSILYGCAASVCAALGINPALGIIHRGDARSLLFDLADLYKPSVTIPLVFAAAREEDPMIAVRKAVRRAIVDHRILPDMLATIMDILQPFLPARDDDRLISGNNIEVSGHIQYG